jgi:hypothetical protein
MTKDRNKRPAMPDFSELAPSGGKGVNKTADWTDIEASTATLAFQRDGIHGTADWSVAPGAPQAPRRPGTEDWSFEPGTAKDAPLGGDGVKQTADWSDLLGD